MLKMTSTALFLQACVKHICKQMFSKNKLYLIYPTCRRLQHIEQANTVLPSVGYNLYEIVNSRILPYELHHLRN